ncbi:MAG: hypothetical protein B5M52_02955 [Helicobacteraceae bacterium 4484_230]|nr:MAG: hypothetical protein B5M52_02955 [Helicobacteraceae bacterium 4484_230]
MLKNKWIAKAGLAGLSILFCFGQLSAAVLKKGPYLIYDGVNTQMKVLWQLDSSLSCTIKWGRDASYSTGAANTDENGSGKHEHQHIYTIDGLTPYTHYLYKINCGAGVDGNGSFYTAPLSDARNVKLLVYGDTRSFPADHDAVNREMINTYTSDPEFQTIALHVGDWVNHGYQEADWSSQFFDPSHTYSNKFQANIPINGVRGNHEGDGNLFLKYFPYPYETGGFYWSFDYGPVHIAIVDQYVDYSPGSVQHNWLKKDLESSTKRWKFIVLHEPGWTAGGHDNNVDVQNHINSLAVKNGVNIIFAGHNHYYARADVDGIQHITTGGGGAPLYDPDSNAEKIVSSSKSYHFCEIDIRGDDLYFTAKDKNGLQIDSFHIALPTKMPASMPSIIAYLFD